MFTHGSLLLTAVWAMLLAPALCSAEFLHHHCANHPQTCSHEPDCEYDPCQQPQNVTSTWRPARLPDRGLDFVVVIVPAVPVLELSGLPATPTAIPPPAPTIHDSDLPLLL